MVSQLYSEARCRPPSQLESWLTLVHAPGIGPASAQKLLRHFHSADGVVQASRSALVNAGLNAKAAGALAAAAESDAIQQDLHWMADGADRHILAFDSTQYPSLLKQIAQPPPVLYVRGDIEALHAPQLAIVGSRKPSAYARRVTARLSTELCALGLTITSGLAHGIDAEAHQAALQAGSLTIAVTGTGLDRVYPARHHALAHQIAQCGALVSEFPIGTNPKPSFFPRRNRIISGLSYGALVIEAALKSGSLTTAAHATEQSREVFAVPGNIDNPLARGCHALIRKGATLVETAQDVIEQLAPMLPGALEIPLSDPTETDSRGAPQLSADASALLEKIDFEAVSLDELVERTGMQVARLAELATELEMAAKIETRTGGAYCRVR